MPNPAPVELLTAADAEDRQRRAAGALLQTGLTPGDRVAFTVGGGSELLCAVLGAARVGLLPVLCNPALTPSEQQAQLETVTPAAVYADLATVTALGEGAPVELAPYPLTRPLHFTSGTTGRAKAVTTGPYDEATAKAVVDDEASLWELGPGDRFFMCSPVHHTVAVRFAVTALLGGADLFVTRHFEAEAALEVLRRGQPTAAFMVPTHLQRLLSLPELSEREQFSSLAYLAHAGSSCPPSLKRAAMARVPARRGVVEFYGATEAQFTYCSQEEWLSHPGTVGRARAARTLSIDASAAGDDHGSIGTIWCEQPSFARFAYFGDPAATAASWRGDACSVFDLGELDADGYLYLSGRRQDLVITGGVNVYPAEVEAALSAVPGVLELAVFGADDGTWGQRVCCAVVASGVDEATLREVATERLAPFKRPKDYYFVPSLPTTSTGKVLRRSLAEFCGA